MILTDKILIYGVETLIKDVSLNSHKKIHVRCDFCQNEKDITYQDYNKITKNSTESYYCCKCKGTKSKKTKLHLYGSENYNNIRKNKETCLSKYGVDNISKIDFIKDKKRSTCTKNYGVDIPAKSDIILKRMSETCLKKYGFPYFAQTEECKENYIKTCLKKYGVKNIFQVKNLVKDSLIRKYGVDHPMRDENIFYKQMTSSYSVKVYNGLYYQGSYELDFIKYCELNNITISKISPISYDNDRMYFPDFFIESINLIIEIKSSYTYEKELQKNLLKKQSCLDKGYNFLFIIDKDYTTFNSLIL